MSNLTNALGLIRDSDFQDAVMIGMVFQARVVFTESAATPSHENRLSMAKAVISNPGVYADRMKNVIAADPDVASLGMDAESIPEATLIAKIAAVWTIFADNFFAPA